MERRPIRVEGSTSGEKGGIDQGVNIETAILVSQS